ncbi:uncharacterized protein PFL1_03507 [Pseudozyma flocculosa PF-1]|uniref:Amino acid permease/ SLC12A domain-containing protein n=1 Tax=Pseudozyma flocculosa PF-1 TaxID=1277687 RepID=A0A061HB08_9BASI|nr:uncharacterized protein PFL1_03507 [Pseudozyma flocculosa PF-1]EPQ29220.1 hypothetical protein PFL1_03507 [Pseudozyma flocculosa PF-1]
MIALGGSIGTGLTIGTGGGLATSGPVSLTLGFLFMGIICYAVMAALAEMGTYMPHDRGFPGYATQFVSPELGFAVGWAYYLKYTLAQANNLNAAAYIIEFWSPGVNGGVWIAICLCLMVTINYFGAKSFGRVEYLLGWVKVATMAMLICINIVLFFGGGPTHDRIGFRNWTNGTAFLEFKAKGAAGRFLGFWQALGSGLYAYMGTELLSIAVGEAANPRKAVPSAIKKTVFRITFFYIFNVALLGLVVPARDPLLRAANKAKLSATASPFVVALEIAKIKGLPHLLNALFLFFVVSAAISDQYIAIRTLYSLSATGQAPAVFSRTNRRGMPMWSLLASSLISCVAFINVASGGAKLFKYFVSSLTIIAALAWISILTTYLRFHHCLRVQNPYLSWVALSVTALVMISRGWVAFVPWDHVTFILTYIGLAWFLVMLVAYKLVMRSKIVPARLVDLTPPELIDDYAQDDDDNGAGQDGGAGRALTRALPAKAATLARRVLHRKGQGEKTDPAVL